MTCGACPEQYDVYDDDDNIVGYLRLRHGMFAAHVDGSGGDVVYSASVDGDGSFTSGERDEHLRRAIDNIAIVLEQRRINAEYHSRQEPE